MTGKQHMAMSVGGGLGVAVGGAMAIKTEPIGFLLAAIGCLVGVFFTPDHDVDSGNYTNLIFRSVKLDWIWKPFWTPYRKAFRHRSVWSHGPVLSTIIRVIYLCLPAIVLLLHEDRMPNVLSVILAQIIAVGWWVVIGGLIYLLGVNAIWLAVGMMYSDLLHWLGDR